MLFVSIVKLTLSLFILVFQPGQDTPYLIQGRAVNANGHPVKNAIIAWDSLQERGGTVELGRTDTGGRFVLAIPQYMKSKPLRLFVTTEIPKQATVLLSPPFITEPSYFVDGYAGPQVVLDKQIHVNVGDVSVKMVFIPLNLTILDYNGVPRLRDAKAWSKVVIRLLDKQGRPIAASTISDWDINRRRTVDLAKSKIKVAVPEGDWRIEVALESFDGPFFGRTIQVSRQQRKNLNVLIRTQ